MNKLKNPVQASIQETVERMREHYAKTGAYTSDQLTKVLGDPLAGIGLRMSKHPEQMKRRDDRSRIR